MNRLNVLRCVDQLFWAYAMIAKEHMLYTIHNMTYQKHDEVNLDKQDIVYIHSPDIGIYHANGLPLEAKKRNIKVIGAYAGNPLYWSPAEQRTYSHADLIVTISPQTYSFAKFHYTNIPVIYIPECVDTNFFKQKQFNENTFKIGWAGGKHKKIKRFNLAEQLDFPIILQDNWKERRKINTRELDLSHMKNFYNNIDVLVVTSESECQPRVVMEAMATGIPVVATNVGSMKMLLDKEWIVDVYPDENVVKQINEKLDLLKNNSQLRKEVGDRNKHHIHKYFSWENNKQLWDNTFWNIYNNNINNIIKDTTDFLIPFKNDFESEFLSFKPNHPEPLPSLCVKSIIETQNFFLELNKTNIHYWTARKTCLNVINKQPIITPLLLGVKTLEEQKQLEKFIKTHSISDMDIVCILEPNIQKTKQMPFNNILVNVPMPVKNYLENLFGKGCINK